MKKLCLITGFLMTLLAFSAAWAQESGAQATSTLQDLPYSATIPSDLAYRLNDHAVTNALGQIIVSGTEGTWTNRQGRADNPAATRDAIFDGNASTFFDPPSEQGALGNCWAGIEFQKPMYVTKIRYKGRPQGDSAALSRVDRCEFRGANLPDFSDEVVIATANRVNDKPAGSPGWNGINFWMEIDLAYHYSTNYPLSQAVRVVPAFKYVRVVSPDATREGQDQSGTCCGNFSEIEFYGVDHELANDSPVLRHEEYKPEITSVQVRNDVLTMDLNFYFPMENDEEDVNLSLFGYEIIRQDPLRGGGYEERVLEGGFLAIRSDAMSSHYQFIDTHLRPFTRYIIRTFNVAAISPAAEWEMPMLQIRPLDVTTRPSASESGAAEVTWTNEADELLWGAMGLRVYRGTAPGGPWTLLTETPLETSATSFLDTTATPGITYYYELRYLMKDIRSLDESAFFEGVGSEVASYLNAMPIERQLLPDGSTRLKDGMKAICHFKPWNAQDSEWQNIDGQEFAKYDGDPAHLFDGNIQTCSDIQPAGNNKQRDAGYCKAGVDLGQPYVITRVRVAPRSPVATLMHRTRFNNAALFGSNSDSTTQTDGWRDDANILRLTDRFVARPSPTTGQWTDGQVWDDIVVTNTTPVRYVFIKHDLENVPITVNGEAFANASELELFGYLPGESSDVLIAPMEGSAIVYEDAQNPYGRACTHFTWQASPNAQWYQIERRSENDTEWTIVDSHYTGASEWTYDDVSPEVKNSYFRCASVREKEDGTLEYAYSLTIRPYVLGKGTGLYAVYTHPYEKNLHQVKEWIHRVDPMINFDWGLAPIIPEAPASTNDVYITWSGYLVVPVTGFYNFKVNSDGGFALRIDDRQVINHWVLGTGSVSEENEIYLAEGRHKIRADYQTKIGTREKWCNLSWGGAVKEGLVPMEQLIPEPLPRMSYPWMGERTFDSLVKGYCDYAPTRDENGELVDGFMMYAAGGDFWLLEDAGHWVWRMVTGDFSISAKFERQTQVLAGAGNDYGWAWKGMLLARKDLGKASPLVCASFASNGYAGRADLKIRDSKNSNIEDWGPRVWDLPSVVFQKLERKGNVYTQSFSETGEDGSWTDVKSWTDTENVLAGTIYIGPAMSSILNLRELGSYRVTIVKVKSGVGTGLVYIR